MHIHLLKIDEWGGGEERIEQLASDIAGLAAEPRASTEQARKLQHQHRHNVAREPRQRSKRATEVD